MSSLTNRAARRARAAKLRSADKRAEDSTWPATLTPIPRETWPAVPSGRRLIDALRSRSFMAQVYDEGTFQGLALRRLSVNRVTLGGDGKDWQDGITWDELQRCKREAGYGDWYAIEVYPRDVDMVCDCNMRHLWLLSEPMPIGWFRPVT